MADGKAQNAKRKTCVLRFWPGGGERTSASTAGVTWVSAECDYDA
jgi:hypothetical protein